MIPEAFLAEWRVTSAPWQQLAMVEQDLVISRALLNIYDDDYLRDRLAFRGGTALYKLYLVPPARYSEDIDLVQINAEPIRETVVHLQAALDPWLGQPRYTATAQSVKLLYRFAAEATPGLQQRLKIEINTREHLPAFGLVNRPFTVQSRWVDGTVMIPTYAIDELLGTKLRALYQRKKGRDLFDVDYAMRQGEVDGQRVLTAFMHYVSRQGLRITTGQYQANLREKMTDPRFGADIAPLLRDGIAFSLDEALARVEEQFLRHLDAAWSQVAEPVP
jgi:predicted nucleotidyltransferase component of viral defense system